MDRRTGYTTGEVSRITGLTLRQIQYWDKSGFIGPSIVETVGKSSRRIYSFRDLVAIRAAQKLLGAGLPLQRVRYAIKKLQEQLPDADAKDILCQSVFITDGERLFELVKDPPRLIEILSGQTAFLYAVGMKDLVGKLDSELRSFEEIRSKFYHNRKSELTDVCATHL